MAEQCKKGHEISGDNISVYWAGGRKQCKICEKESVVLAKTADKLRMRLEMKRLQHIVEN